MNEELSTVKTSFWPILLALAVLLIAIGVVSTLVTSISGIFLLLIAITGWIWENRNGEAEGENE